MDGRFICSSLLALLVLSSIMAPMAMAGEGNIEPSGDPSHTASAGTVELNNTMLDVDYGSSVSYLSGLKDILIRAHYINNGNPLPLLDSEATLYYTLDGTDPSTSPTNFTMSREAPAPVEPSDYYNVAIGHTNFTSLDDNKVFFFMIHVTGTSGLPRQDDWLWDNGTFGSYKYKLDTTQPEFTSVKSDKKEYEAVSGGVQVTISAAVKDSNGVVIEGDGIDEVTITVTGPENKTFIYKDGAGNITKSSGSDTYSNQTKYTKTGRYNYTIAANDSFDNWNSTNGRFWINDTLKPAVSIQQPGSDYILAGKTYMNVTATAADSFDSAPKVNISVLKDGTSPTANTTMSRVGATNVYYYNLTTGISGGSNYAITVHATDGTGNYKNASKSTRVWTSYVAPTFVTTAATSVDADSAILGGRIDGMGSHSVLSYRFQYGLTNGYGMTTGTDSKSSTGEFSIPVYGLESGTTYHYRAEVQNVYGTWIPGADKTFQTPASITNAPPTCILTASPASGDAPLQVTFSVSASDSDGTVASWAVDFDNDGTYDSQGTTLPASVTHTYLSAGSYVARLKVTDNGGAIAYATATVTVSEGGNQPPTCTLAASPASGVSPLTVTFAMTATDQDGTIASWKLDIDNDGNTDYFGTGAPLATKAHTYTVNGTYTAKLTVTDNGGISTHKTTTVKVFLAPTCTLSAAPSSGNAPLEVTFTMTASDLDGAIASWRLDVNDDGTAEYSASGAPSEYRTWTYDAGGVYTARLTVTDNDGASASRTASVTVGKAPVTIPLGEEDYVLIDQDGDGGYDAFRKAGSDDILTGLQKNDDGTYYFDTDGDGKWDYVYDPVAGTVDDYGKTFLGLPMLYVYLIAGVIVLLLALIIIGIIVGAKRSKQ